MMKLAAIAVAIVLLQVSPTLAGGFSDDLMKDAPPVNVLKAADDGAQLDMGGPSLSTSEIAAIQYHEPSAVVPGSSKIRDTGTKN